MLGYLHRTESILLLFIFFRSDLSNLLFQTTPCQNYPLDPLLYLLFLCIHLRLFLSFSSQSLAFFTTARHAIQHFFSTIFCTSPYRDITFGWGGERGSEG